MTTSENKRLKHAMAGKLKAFPYNKRTFMKRIALVAGLALTMLSCAQHDTQSPDTSGVDPQSPNDTTTTLPGDSTANGSQNSGGTTTNSGGTMNNQQNQ